MISTKIGLNKWRLLLIILVAVLFTMNGLTMLLETKDIAVRTNPFLVKLIGILSVLFFGVLIYISSKQLFDTEMGVTLDEDGLTDRSNQMSVGLVKWENITRIKTVQFLWLKSLAIYTNNPEKYLREASGLKLRILAGHLKKTATPVVISTRNLKIKHPDFEQLVKNFWAVSKEIKK